MIFMFQLLVDRYLKICSFNLNNIIVIINMIY